MNVDFEQYNDTGYAGLCRVPYLDQQSKHADT